MTEPVQDIDRGWKRIKLHMKKQARSDLGVDVGIIGEKAEKQHPEGKLTNADVGTFQEYGTETIPERSFIRATIDEKHNDIARLFERISKGALAGKIDLRRGLGLVGAQVIGWIKSRIHKGIPPPLQDSTIRRKTVQGKKGTTPLIDTSTLIGSIAHAVRGAAEGDK